MTREQIRLKAKRLYVFGCVLTIAALAQIVMALVTHAIGMALIGFVCVVIALRCCWTNWWIWKS